MDGWRSRRTESHLTYLHTMHKRFVVRMSEDRVLDDLDEMSVASYPEKILVVASVFFERAFRHRFE